MDNYLEHCITQLSQQSQWSSAQPIELVIGNESCDLDSAVSAVGLAYVKYTQYVKQGSNDRIVIPILNTTRKELELKTEVLFWFENSVHINRNELICRDQIDWEALKTKKVSITLVDHNSNKQLSRFGEIVEVIDHHKYDPKECVVTDSSKLVIDESVGSCSTLIAERFLASDLRDDTQMALMFFGTIILDTINFSESAQRFSERDKKVVKQLESIIEESITRSEVYQQLIEAKNSINNLTFEQILLKDSKIVPNPRIIISSISGHLVSGLGLEDKRQRLQEFATNASNRFDAIIILGVDNTNPNHVKRDIAIFADNENTLQTIALKLESETSGLGLKLTSDARDLKVYTQTNIKASRKVILPLIASLGQTNGTDVDPDFVLNYIPETVDFLESPQYSSMETEVPNEHCFPSSPLKEPSNASPKEASKESELEMPAIDASKLNNPDSFYGSYIEDSFVGELVGDYQNSLDSDKDNDLDNGWPLNNGMNNEIEFDFDSFGPESIIYTGDVEAVHEENGHKPRHSQSEETLNAEPNENELTSSTQSAENDDKIDETNKTIVEDKDNSETNGNKSFLDIPLESNPTSDYVSDLSANNGEERDEISPFKRNSSLTQSQRKKISPRMTIHQILNSSDDMSPVTTHPDIDIPSGHPLDNSQSVTNDCEPNDATNDRNANTLSPNDSTESKGLVRRPSTTKKKINVNREFFASDEMNDKPRTGEPSQPIEPMSARQELEESRAWKESCPIGPAGDVKPIDMKVIDPYKKVISHGGYFHSSTLPENSHQSGSSPAIIVFSACYLPDRSRKDYNYVMDHLFMYVLTTLHNLIADDYILIYFHNAGVTAPGNNMPTFGWLKRCYYMIDRKLKKNLKGLYMVHPTFWLKTLIIMSKPFISSKFSRKLKFVTNLAELSALLPIEHLAIPEEVKLADSLKQKKSRRITQ